LIGYVVDEVVDVDDEIIRQLVEWDCDVSSEMDRAIVYCLTRQSVERVASIANNVACVRTAHLHAHLDENAKKTQLQSWLSGEARVMVATGVIGCGYNYSRSGWSFTMDLLGLLLLCTKSRADLLATVNLVLAE
jgi:superfamily II DNA helicase RecQ